METTINSHDDACKFLGKSNEVPDVEKFGKATVALHKLMDIIEARNKEHNSNHKFDWNNRNQLKWQPWFDMEVDENNPSGFRFDGAGYDRTYSSVGSRLCSETEELCVDIATKHLDLYRDFMVIE